MACPIGPFWKVNGLLRVGDGPSRAERDYPTDTLDIFGIVTAKNPEQPPLRRSN